MSMFSRFRPPTPTPVFSLPALLDAWTDAPRFLGKKKADPPVATWLAAVASGCREHQVPRKHWPVVAKALMGEKALARLAEFERVLVKMENKEDVTEYEWTWERFEVAVGSMGWEISKKKMHTFKVAVKKCGQWWVIGKKDKMIALDRAAVAAQANERDSSKKSGHTKLTSEPTEITQDWVSVDDHDARATVPKVRKTPVRAMSDSLVSVFKSFPAPSDEPSSELNTTAVAVPSPPILPPAPRRANTEPPVLTTVTHAPDWLISAVGALDFLTSTHPTTMSALSAVLLTVGSVPALAATGGLAAFPALAATAGGHAVLGVLGSGTAQAVGAVVMGLGSWIKTVNEGQVQISR